MYCIIFGDNTWRYNLLVISTDNGISKLSFEFFRKGKKNLLKKRNEQKYTANVPQAILNVTKRENEITEFKF